jgi:2-phospho-L-lactate guanylyltransferase
MAERAFWAVVPVKSFHHAKRRLAPVMDAAERAQLAHLMLRDVLDALVACGGLLAGIIVVTRDAAAAETARAHAAQALCDAATGGINAAVGVAIRHLAGRVDTGVIVLPSDIPQLAPDTIEQVTAGMSAARAVAIVPATHDGGTNLLACMPAGAIAPCFGLDSFRRHCRAAQHAGIAPSVMIRADIGRDIDRPNDLAAFLSTGPATRTHAFLEELGVAQRLRRWSRETRSHADVRSAAILDA